MNDLSSKVFSDEKDLKPDSFIVKACELSDLFNVDNIHNGISLNQIKKKYDGVSALLSTLKTDAEKGISSSSIEIRKACFGNNNFKTLETRIFKEFVKECFGDITLVILIAFVILYLAFGIIKDPKNGWYEGVGILTIIFIIILATSIKNYLEYQKLKDFNNFSQTRKVTVIRDGKEISISSFDLVVGDIIKIKKTCALLVDALIISSEDLFTDEFDVCGEIEPNKKDAENFPFLLSGSKISGGKAVAVVLAVGTNSLLSRNIENIELSESEETQLNHKIENTVLPIAKLSLIIVIFTFLMLFGYQIYDIIKNGRKYDNLQGITKCFMISIACLITSIPETLPLILASSLAFSIDKMKNNNIKVKRLNTLENLSQVTTICTDKTEFLTKTDMKVVSMCIGKDNIFNNTDKNDIDQEVINYLGWHFCHNTTSDYELTDNEDFPTSSRIELSLLKLAKEWGFDYKNIRNKEKIIFQIPFNPNHKKMYTIVEESGTIYIFIKGASEYILDMCSKYVSKGGHTHELDAEEKVLIKTEVISKFAIETYRTLGFAYKKVNKRNTSKFFNTDGTPNIQALERKMILLGIFGIQDQIKPEISDTIKCCQNAGITIRIVTGEHPETAIAIAKQCNIIDKNYTCNNDDIVLTGEQFRNRVGKILSFRLLNEKKNVVQNFEVFKEIAIKLKVLARCTPEDKLLFVTGLNQLKEIVAVTGLDNSDISAFDEATVRLSTNYSNQITQSNSDIIISNGFDSITKSVLWSRNVYDFIGKIIQFHLTAVIVFLIINFVGVIFLKVSPITTIQMLWFSLILDILAPLALIDEFPKKCLLKSKPVNINDSLITQDIQKNIFGQVIYQLFWLFYILITIDKFIYDYNINSFNQKCHSEINNEDHVIEIENQICSQLPQVYKFTILFNAFIMMQIFNEISCREIISTEFNVFNNLSKKQIFIVLLEISFQICVVQFGGQLFQFSPLSIQQHFFCLCIGAGSLVFGIAFRLVPSSAIWFLNTKIEAGSKME
ncbi:hypothetical protein SteCoe_15729 [Stentor coeruleus]|uniref:Cation-transporting P-type ATPase N-terminal domain-containing protein n=1 Tax=Stentor coeruleus TaxID=5963 RepID=A0A1R2C2Y0_9CILI|nr:hypothetical protein SteCoe_15729 [Stentor coeruleus]